MPAPYTPPLTDIAFVLQRLIGLDALASLPAYASLSADVVEAVVGEAAKLAAGEFAPLNDIGDKKGVVFDGAAVVMPPGFKDAYQAYIDGGWNGLPVEETHGGQGLPFLLAMAVNEMMQAANISLALCPLLNQGAIELLSAHGSDAIKKKFLPNLVSGVWTGTMNLTEPQAGSDVGAVTCKAERLSAVAVASDAQSAAVAEQSRLYKITGQKIFISYGNHDMAENILHLVLARLPNAPEGTRGLSLFLVPKILVDETGALGDPNDVRVVSVEHKLGQHASPTCVMAYGDDAGAIGYLVGRENGGINAMFTMMNNARISVGIQGLGLMERAYQQARDFARVRVQSRPIDNLKAPPVAIIHHPDVKRMLLGMKAHIEAARALAYSCGLAVDQARHMAGEAKNKAAARVDLLTPIVKAWLTDLANDVTSTAVQVYGGMGYIEESGIAQHMRDARILAIYEGTNGIQANDLLFRKLARDDGAAFAALLAEIDILFTQLPSQEPFTAIGAHLCQASVAAKDSGLILLAQIKQGPALAAASASLFLRLSGTLLGGYHLARSALMAHSDIAAGAGDAEFLWAKIDTAQFYAVHMLPACAAWAATIRDGGASVIAFPDAQL